MPDLYTQSIRMAKAMGELDLYRESKRANIICKNGIERMISDRFDGHTHEHYHFTCEECKRVLDLELKEGTDVNKLTKDFGGMITSHALMFFGICHDCKAV